MHSATYIWVYGVFTKWHPSNSKLIEYVRVLIE